MLQLFWFRKELIYITAVTKNMWLQESGICAVAEGDSSGIVPIQLIFDEHL